jgi:hypothetical protein
MQHLLIAIPYFDILYSILPKYHMNLLVALGGGRD